MLRQVIIRREEKENLEEIKACKEFNKFQKELHEYKTFSAREDYAQLTFFPFVRKRALLSVATYSYGGDITQDDYENLVQMSKKELLESLDDYINEMETPDTPDDPDTDTYALDD